MYLFNKHVFNAFYLPVGRAHKTSHCPSWVTSMLNINFSLAFPYEESSFSTIQKVKHFSYLTASIFLNKYNINLYTFFSLIHPYLLSAYQLSHDCNYIVPLFSSFTRAVDSRCWMGCIIHATIPGCPVCTALIVNIWGVLCIFDFILAIYLDY